METTAIPNLLRKTATLATAATSVILLGCRTAATAPPPSPPSAEGLVGFEYASDAPRNPPRLEAGQDYRAADPRPDNAMPVYPAELVPLGLRKQHIVVRVIIASDGRVARFEESSLPSDADPQYREAFRRAVEETVLNWQFEPAHIRSFGPGPDLDHNDVPDYQVMVGDAAITSYHDLRFLFEVRQGRGVVTGE